MGKVFIAEEIFKLLLRLRDAAHVASAEAQEKQASLKTQILKSMVGVGGNVEENFICWGCGLVRHIKEAEKPCECKSTKAEAPAAPEAK